MATQVIFLSCREEQQEHNSSPLEKCIQISSDDDTTIACASVFMMNTSAKEVVLKVFSCSVLPDKTRSISDLVVKPLVFSAPLMMMDPPEMGKTINTRAPPNFIKDFHNNTTDEGFLCILIV